MLHYHKISEICTLKINICSDLRRVRCLSYVLAESFVLLIVPSCPCWGLAGTGGFCHPLHGRPSILQTTTKPKRREKKSNSNWGVLSHDDPSKSRTCFLETNELHFPVHSTQSINANHLIFATHSCKAALWCLYKKDELSMLLIHLPVKELTDNS